MQVDAAHPIPTDRLIWRNAAISAATISSTDNAVSLRFVLVVSRSKRIQRHPNRMLVESRSHESFPVRAGMARIPPYSEVS